MSEPIFDFTDIVQLSLVLTTITPTMCERVFIDRIEDYHS